MSNTKLSEIEIKAEVGTEAIQEMSFIANANNDGNEVIQPKRWFNVCAALLIALTGCCIGVIIGMLIYSATS